MINYKTTAMLLTTLAIITSASGCKKANSVVTGTEEVTVKVTSGDSAKYIQFSDKYITNNMDSTRDNDSICHTDILYKDTVDGEYKKLTDIYKYMSGSRSSDYYIDVSSLSSILTNIPELADSTYQIEDLSKKYMLVNDSLLQKAMDSYITNNPNVAGMAKSRIITEKETAYGEKEGASLRTQEKLKQAEAQAKDIKSQFIKALSRAEGVQMLSSRSITDRFNDYFYSIEPLMQSYISGTTNRFGVEQIKVKGEEAKNLIGIIKDRVSIGDTYSRFVNSVSDGAMSTFLFENGREKATEALTSYFESLYNNCDENAEVEFCISTRRYKDSYIKIWNGTEGIEVLCKNKRVSGLDTDEIDSNIPTDVFTIDDVYKEMASKYLNK